MKTRLFKSIFCLFLLTLMALHVAAQDKVKLSGRVIDDEQNPVLFAVVKVDGQAAGTTTDLQGRYQLEFSTADTVTVSFSMIGYVTKKKTLVRPKGSLRLNITLQTQSIDMGEVTVKEVRRQMNSTQHLNAENLKRLPSTTGNAVEELVATQAGVSTHNELSSQYNVRGGSLMKTVCISMEWKFTAHAHQFRTTGRTERHQQRHGGKHQLLGRRFRRQIRGQNVVRIGHYLQEAQEV